MPRTSGDPTRDARFDRSRRLTRPEQYRRAFRTGRRISDRFFTVVAAPNDAGAPRLGLAIARKAAPRAVDRSRLKRVVRETFRLRRDVLGSWDLVVMARPSAGGSPNDTLRTSLLSLWQKLAQ